MFLPAAPDTEALGTRLASALLAHARSRGEPGVVGTIHLQGPLGAGKTTLVRGLARGLGIEGPVKSPTYTLVEPYAAGATTLYHFDLYRIADGEELEYLGARDAFAGGALCVVEWPERGAGWLPEPDLRVTLGVSDDGREAAIEARSRRGRAVVALLGADSPSGIGC